MNSFCDLAAHLNCISLYFLLKFRIQGGGGFPRVICPLGFQLIHANSFEDHHIVVAPLVVFVITVEWNTNNDEIGAG